MRRGEVWWVEFDERRPVVLLSGEDPSAFDGVLRFAFPHPGFIPCTSLTTLSRDDLIEQAGAVSAAKLSEIDDALRTSEQRTEWTPAAVAMLSEMRDSLRRRGQADREAADVHTSKGRSRPDD